MTPEQLSGVLLRAGSITGDRVYLTKFRCHITGWQHSQAFQYGRIKENETLLSAFRERSHSALEGRPFNMRQGDQKAVVLRLNDADPSTLSPSSANISQMHEGYLRFGTKGREGVVELMHNDDIDKFVKIVCVYPSTTVQKWIRSGGRACSGYEGQVFVFVDPKKKNEIAPKVTAVLGNYNLND